MQGFIKRFSDFETSKTFRAVEWDIALRSVQDEVSTVVVVAGDVDAGDVGDWLIVGGALLRIESVQAGSSTTTVKCRDIASAFARTFLIRDLIEEETISLFIMTTLGQQFNAASDAAYALPYLRASATTAGDIAYHAPETDDYGRFEFDEYLRMVARVYNIHLSWASSGADELHITVGRGTMRGGQIVLGAGTDQLAETPIFASAEVAKITVLQKTTAEDGTESVSKSDRYLYTDGTFGASATGGTRAEGGWEYLTVSPSATEDEIEDKVAQRFERGMSDSKISFFSARELDVGAPVVLRVAGRKYSGYITYKGVKSSDKRYFYRCGNRPVTLTEKLRAVEKTAQTVETTAGGTSGGGGGTGGGAVTSVNGKTGAVTIGAEIVSGEDITPSSVKMSSGGTVTAALYQTADGRGVLALRDKDHANQDGVQAYALANGAGGVLTRNKDGNTAVTLAASMSGLQANAGGVVAHDSGGVNRATMGVGTDGGGVLRLKDAEGNTSTLTKELIDQIGTGAVESVNGKTGAVTIGAEVVSGEDITPSQVDIPYGQTSAARLSKTEDGRGAIELRRADGTLGMKAYANTTTGGEVDIYNGSGARRAALYTVSSGEGRLRLWDASGTPYNLTPDRLAVWPCNPNLLDNWYFPNAVNQRGSSSYSAGGYGIDRWILNSVSYTCASRSITVTGSESAMFYQRVEYVSQTAMTFSVLLANGTLYTLTTDGSAYAYTETSFGSIFSDARAESGMGAFGLKFSDNSVGVSVAITAAKLELGAQQTLAHKDANGAWVLNEVPNYAEQLARCQRYYYKLPSGYGTCHNLYGRGVVMSISTPVAMRTPPTATYTTAQVFSPAPQSAWYTLTPSYVYRISAAQYDLSFTNTGGATMSYGISFLINVAAELSAEL